MLAFQASVGIRTALAAQHQRKMENPLDYCVRCMGVAFEQAARVSKTREAWDVRTAELGMSIMNMQLKSVEINSRLDLFCIHSSAYRLCCHAVASVFLRSLNTSQLRWTRNHLSSKRWWTTCARHPVDRHPGWRSQEIYLNSSGRRGATRSSDIARMIQWPPSIGFRERERQSVSRILGLSWTYLKRKGRPALGLVLAFQSCGQMFNIVKCVHGKEINQKSIVIILPNFVLSRLFLVRLEILIHWPIV